MNHRKNYFLDITLAGLLSLGTAQISFGQNLVTDGTFSNLSVVQSGSTVGAGLNSASNPSYTTGDTLASWTSQGYNFIFTNGNAGSTSVTGADGALSLYGPGNGVANGLTTPPGGGNVIAMDGVYETGPLTQVINGLQSGKTYTVSFEWAGAQQSGFAGGTTEGMSVALGAATGVFTSGALTGGQSTTEVSDPYEGIYILDSVTSLGRLFC